MGNKQSSMVIVPSHTIFSRIHVKDGMSSKTRAVFVDTSPTTIMLRSELAEWKHWTRTVTRRTRIIAMNLWE